MSPHDSSGPSAAVRPIGVFDSGVGGLSVLRAIRSELPAEHLIYVADSKFAPYGDRPPDFVRDRTFVLTDFLVAKGAKAVVVACNTATGISVDDLRARFAVPIVAIEPALKPAAALTQSGVVGVLATTGTLASDKFMRLLANQNKNVQFLVQPAPGLADQVERGEVSGAATRTLVERFVTPLIRKGADVLVLGCTHYPYLTDLIQEVAGVGVQIIDPADAVARELRRRLEAAGELRSLGAGIQEFWTTGSVETTASIVSRLWGSGVSVQRVPDSC